MPIRLKVDLLQINKSGNFMMLASLEDQTGETLKQLGRGKPSRDGWLVYRYGKNEVWLTYKDVIQRVVKAAGI